MYPACDRIVYDCAPDEYEDAGRGKRASFHCASHDDLSSCTIISKALNIEIRSKDKLKEIEKKIGNPGTADTSSAKGIHHPKVIEITDEFVGSMGEGERITPEEPLAYQPCKIAILLGTI